MPGFNLNEEIIFHVFILKSKKAQGERDKLSLLFFGTVVRQAERHADYTLIQQERAAMIRKRDDLKNTLTVTTAVFRDRFGCEKENNIFFNLIIQSHSFTEITCSHMH